MIRDYLEHSANERTYLAWIRAAITIMTLGFFVQEFDLHLTNLHASMEGAGGWKATPDKGMHLISILLVVLGIAILASGTYRFVAIKRKLEMDESQMYSGLIFALAISGLLGGFGVVLLLYLLRLI